VQQQRNVQDILGVIAIPESALISHLNWGTWHFQDIVFRRLGGRNPFGNATVRYTGSHDDAALNAAVFRAAPDPSALAALAEDTDPTARIPVPVLTVHGIHDPTAFVELESVFRETMIRAGNGERLVQLFTDDDEHSYLSDAQYVTAMRALLTWVERGVKPTPRGMDSMCRALEERFAPATGCRMLPDYGPRPLGARVPKR
jgi:hypothetical protein